MFNKVKEILNSVRFWQVVLGALMMYVESKGWVDQALRDLVITVLGVSVTLGTADSVATRLAGK